jgi:HK97 gp10 family phage protein
MKLQATATYKPRGDLGRWIEANVTPAILSAMKDSVVLIQESAKALCPVDTGALRESITTEVEVGKTVVGRVGPHMPYAGYVEFGTGIRGAASPGAGEGPYSESWPGQPAQPFLRPSLDQNRKAVEELFRGEIAIALR